MSEKPTPTSVEHDLDETRSRLGTHLNELQDRLSPGQVLDDAMRYFRGSEGGAFSQDLMASIRANPMPAAITGIGLAWLMASNARRTPGADRAASGSASHHDEQDGHADTLRRVREAENGVAQNADESAAAYAARLDAARGQALGLARHTQETAESFGERVRGALASAQRTMAKTAHDARDHLSSAADSVSSSTGSVGASALGAARGAATQASGAISQGGRAGMEAGTNLIAALGESPVLLGALGLAAGALLGALIPQSEQEEAALGGVAKQARDTATSVANQGVEAGRHVAGAVADKASESAEQHGLAGGTSPGELVDAALSGELAEGVSEVAKDALRKSDEAVRGEISPRPRNDGQPMQSPSQSR